MGNNSTANVSVGKPKIGGAIFRAPATVTTKPTTATAQLIADYVNIGYISTDGVVNANTKTSTPIKAWGGDTVAIPQTDHSDQFRMTAIESLNPDTLKMAHGDANVSGTLATGITVNINGKEDGSHVYVIDQELKGNVKKRIVIPDGYVSEVGEVTYKDDTAISYPITITALPDSSENTHYEYIVKVTTTT